MSPAPTASPALQAVTGARVLGEEGLLDLLIRDGAVDAIRSAGSTPPGRVLEAGGRLVLPAFVDAHVHLDKAYLLGHPDLDTTGRPGVTAAIAAVGALRSVLSMAEVRDLARRAVDALVRNGTTAARVHVEIDPVTGLDNVQMHLELAAERAGSCALQLVAFPQRGLERPGTADLMAAAMKEGLAVVGGCPYVDKDPVAHLDLVFTLAERHSVPVDLHLDFGDDPDQSLIPLVVERTTAHGMQGQVTIGHVTTLAAMDPDHRARALDALATHGISLVSMPATDLHLVGQGSPGTRSTAPVLEAAAAGVRVAIANNNIANPFSPFGNAHLLQAAWLAGVLGRASTPTDQGALLRAITQAPAEILSLLARGPTVGSQADFAVLDTEDATRVVAGAPAVCATVSGGRVVHLGVPPTMSG